MHAWGRAFVKIMEGESLFAAWRGQYWRGEKRDEREQESEGQQKHEKLGQGRIEFAVETQQNRQRPAVPASRQTLFKLAAVAWRNDLRHLTDCTPKGRRRKLCPGRCT